MAGNSSFEMLVVPSGVAAVESGESCERGSVAEEWGVRAPGRAVVLLDAKGGADGTADADDAERAIGRTAVCTCFPSGAAFGHAFFFFVLL